MNIKIKTKYIASTALFILNIATAEPLSESDYFGGISVDFSGTEGIDYAIEYYYHDLSVTNRKTVYIRDTTLITLSHNELNSLASSPADGYFGVIGIAGLDGIPDSGDEGVIRYKVDRDYDRTLLWSDDTYPTFPDYTGPFSFNELTYNGTTPVVGSTGYTSNSYDDATAYWQGHIGPFGDEWHTIAVADDDKSVIPNTKKVSWSSDGREYIFIVNPTTPAFQVTANGDAQFYTSPAKAYYTPKIHEQITYIKPRNGKINFKITDIFENNIWYRVVTDRNNVTTSYTAAGSNSVTIDSDKLPEGISFIQYYRNDNVKNIKTRTIYKNPTHPSLAESHGNFMWETERELSNLRIRLNREPYTRGWGRLIDRNTLQDAWDAMGQHGYRRYLGTRHPATEDVAFNNALAALIEGYDAKRNSSSPKSYGEYAKEMLLGNNWARVDNVGWEITPHSTLSHPSTEVIGAGYYTVGSITGSFPAYDILVGHFRDDQISGGITSIEDYYLRDQFARFVHACLQLQAIDKEPGMWDTAKSVGAMMIAMCMHEYSSPLYGTSGYGEVQTAQFFTPFPDQAITWKMAYSDRNIEALGFPNLKFNFDPEFIELWQPDGNWGGPNLGYAQLMSGTYCRLLNFTEMYQPDNFSLVRIGIEKAARGELYGLGGTGPTTLSSPLLANKRFPHLGPIISSQIHLRDIENKILDPGYALNLIWYNDNIELAPIQPTDLETK